ncbi:unnamed protein product [Clonostachys solani]|uniref:Citrate synthase n=1 Tax=Clonostachys solani TaxID=160281 RepID=A0A9N9Z138_9HYPO|nr:unnamed protein product [Clonostachys solani]
MSLEDSNTHCLTIHDSRTGKEHTVPIHDNYILAKDLAKIEIDDGILKKKLTILDRGFEHTACTESEITLIDGQRGEIRYRGIPIEDLFNNNDFEEVAHLMVWGHLPSDTEKMQTRGALNAAMVAPQAVMGTIASFPRDAETYPMLMAGLSAFVNADLESRQTRYSHKPVFHNQLDACDKALVRTLGNFASTVALVHCHKRNIKFTQPDPSRSMLSNLLHIMGMWSQPIEDCLNKLWILYCDHEMTNSTAIALHAGSALADPTSAAIASLCAAYGPLHCGAIELAYSGLEQIGHTRNVPAYIELVKQKKMRLFGYGHRIYKTKDPRMTLVERLIADNKDLVQDDPMLRIAFEIDRIANEEEYFTSRNLKANVDLLGCFLYTALGFDRDIIIPTMALSRLPGGMAHWRETQSQPIKLWRPLQVYTGPKYEHGEKALDAETLVDDSSVSSLELKEKGYVKGGKKRFSIKDAYNRLYIKATVAMVRV